MSSVHGSSRSVCVPACICLRLVSKRWLLLVSPLPFVPLPPLPQPPFVQKTIKHGEHPIWLHKNCALYTPECFVEYHEPSEAKASGNSKSSSPSSSSKGTSSASAKSVSGKAGGVKSEVSEKGDGSPSSKSSKGKLKGNDDGDGDTGGGKSERKAEYYGVDAARKRVALKCTSCALQGALIGCHVSSCQVNTHFACAVREGWKFGEPDADGKVRRSFCWGV